MKYFLLTFCLCVLGFAASAQMRDRKFERPGNPTSLNKADNLTRQIAGRLHLNEAQYIQMRIANEIKLARTEEIQWQYQDNPVLRNEKLVQLEAQYEQECQRILTPMQLSLMHEQQQDKEQPKTDPNENSLG